MKPSDFLTELSNEKLGNYKTAAGKDATAADKAGNFKRGNKRMSGITNATKKEFANDAAKAAADAEAKVKKVDEGYAMEDEQIDGMAQGEIREIIKNAIHIKNQLDKGVSLDGWMYSYVTTSNDHLNSVAEQINNPNIDEEQLNELFDAQQEYYKLADGQVIQVDYKQDLNADGQLGSIKIVPVNPKLMPMSGMQAIHPWDKARHNIRTAIQKWVQSGQQGVTEEQLDELSCWSGYHRVSGTKAGFPGSCAKNKTNESEHKCPHCGGEMVSEELMNEKKDACYYKVKSRYKVWPSAYASGALVKCRNKGASNWGNGGKKNESSILEGIDQVDESLHDWFNKEKWVRMDTKGNIKGPCAKEPGEGKPKCLPQAKAHSLGKKGRASAAARKRREDPNPDRSGKAINVNTKKEK